MVYRVEIKVSICAKQSFSIWKKVKVLCKYLNTYISVFFNYHIVNIKDALINNDIVNSNNFKSSINPLITVTIL